jgi:phosphoglycerol transferase MdoB-like AlkP superfamily enzyme
MISGMPNSASLFRPTRWSLLGLLSFWLFRVLTLRAMHRMELDIPFGDYVSLVWDVPLVTAVFVLARVIAPAGRGVRARVLRAMGYGALALVALFDFCMRAADLLYCSLEGSHFNAGAFLYVAPQNIGLLRDGHNPTAVTAVIAGITACVVALVRDGREYRDKVKVATLPPRRAEFIYSLPVFAAVLLPIGSGWSASDEHRAFFMPEATVLRAWSIWRGAVASEGEAELSLRPELVQRFVATGVLPARSLEPEYPLLRPLEATRIAYPETPAAAAGPPNVVLTLVEQLDHEFVSEFSHELPGVMPELSALARRVTIVTNYRSITQPTIHALVASLCSMHAALGYEDLNEHRGTDALEHTALRCLPEILRERGYRTVYIQGGSNRFAGTEGFLRAHGFDEIYGRVELEKLHPERDNSLWGVHDDVLVQFTEQKIRELEAQRAQDGRPFFVMTQTIDMHSPGHSPWSCALPAALRAISDDADSRRMLRAVHCTDKALGHFGHFLLDEAGRADRTLWALTGDHPSEPFAFLNALHKKHGDRFAGWSGRLPLLLHDPTHALPKQLDALAGHLDLGPTLLHLLGISGITTAMEGRSIFGERRQLPLLIGRMAPNFVAIHRPNRTVSLSVDRLLALCSEEAPLIAGDPMALSSCELLAWLRWQNALWKHKRIYPGTDQLRHLHD